MKIVTGFFIYERSIIVVDDAVDELGRIADHEKVVFTCIMIDRPGKISKNTQTNAKNIHRELFMTTRSNGRDISREIPVDHKQTILNSDIP